MDATATLALQIGARAPGFIDLLGVDGSRYSLSSFEDRLGEIDASNGPDGVRVVAINSNNPFLSPSDSYGEMVRRASERRFRFLYLKDHDGTVARTYGAISTPHAFVFDQDRMLRYQGRIADSRIPEKVTSPDLENALRDLLAGRPPRVPLTVPFGCSIVW